MKRDSIRGVLVSAHRLRKRPLVHCAQQSGYWNSSGRADRFVALRAGSYRSARVAASTIDSLAVLPS